MMADLKILDLDCKGEGELQIKNLGGTGLHGGLKNSCSKSLKININSTILGKKFACDAQLLSKRTNPDIFLKKVYTFTHRYHYNIKYLINTCILSLPHDIVLSFFWWGSQIFRNSGGSKPNGGSKAISKILGRLKESRRELKNSGRKQPSETYIT